MNDERVAEDHLVDMHCHVDLFPNPQLIVDAIEASQTHTIAVTNAPSVFWHTERLAMGSKFLHPAVGLHPELVPTHAQELETMWPMLERTRFVGEIGLDYTVTDSDVRSKQQSVFRNILERSAACGDKIVTVHSRRAAADVIAAIGRNYPGRVILHWFTGTVRQVELAAQNGLYFSINLAMLRAEKGQKLIAGMPRERVLIESDGPLMQVNGQPASPGHAVETLSRLAEAWNVSADDALRTVSQNYRDLVRE